MNINYLQPDILELLKEYSQSNDEICGFIIKNEDNSYEYINCENLHPEKDKYFLISPKNYLLYNSGILFHSHPIHSDTEGFSEWDIENQNYHCLDMLLYSVKHNKFYYKEYGQD